MKYFSRKRSGTSEIFGRSRTGTGKGRGLTPGKPTELLGAPTQRTTQGWEANFGLFRRKHKTEHKVEVQTTTGSGQVFGGGHGAVGPKELTPEVSVWLKRCALRCFETTMKHEDPHCTDWIWQNELTLINCLRNFITFPARTF